MAWSAIQGHYGGRKDDLNEVNIALSREMYSDLVHWSLTLRVAEILVRCQFKYTAHISLELGLNNDVRSEQATGLFEK